MVSSPSEGGQGNSVPCFLPTLIPSSDQCRYLAMRQREGHCNNAKQNRTQLCFCSIVLTLELGESFSNQSSRGKAHTVSLLNRPESGNHRIFLGCDALLIMWS